jgi:hypothetical protein
MADPVVHITAGIPDSGTGNITTLGQTLLDGANIALGATTDASYTGSGNSSVVAALKGIYLSVNGSIPAGSNVIGSVKITDGTLSPSVKAGSTAPVATDLALVVTESPNSTVASGIGTPADVPYTGSGTATLVSAMKGVYSELSGPIPAGTNLIGSIKITDGTNIAGVDSSGNLKVTGTGGGGGGTSSNFGSAFPAAGTAAGAEYLSSPPTLTSGQMVALQTDSSGNLKVNVSAGGASGGTSSSFGSAFPATGTAAGAEYLSTPPTLTNGQMVALQTNVSGALKIDGSAVTQPVSGTVTATQSTAANLLCTASQGGTWTVQPGNTANTTPWLATINQGGNSAVVKAASTAAAATDPSLVVNISPNSPAHPVTQSGAWTVQPGNTANTTAWLVTGTGGTFPVTGTFWQATQPVSLASTTITGTVAVTQSGNWTNRIVGNAGATLDAVIGNATAPTNMLAVGGVFNTTRPTLTTGQSAAFQSNSNGVQLVDGSTVTQPVSGTFWQATQPVSGTVTANQGGTWTVQPGNTANTTPWLTTINQGGNSAVVKAASTAAAATDPSLVVNMSPNSPPMAMTQSGTWTVQQGTPPWNIQGDVANAATDSGNPQKIGGLGKTANPTAVTDGQRVNAVFDKQGKQVCVGAIRQLKGVQKTSITVATETTVVTAGTSGVFNDVYAIVLTNKSATGVSVDFKDATAGTTRMTLYAPATDTRGFTVSVDSAMVQAVAANNWTATVSSAVTSIEITMLYVSNL